MSLHITSLNSGSNGNCYYVGNDQEAVLIDAGISCRETEKRMKRLGLMMSTVKAIFISHEHSDHIRGVQTLAKKHGLPVYITSATLRHCSFHMEALQYVTFRAYDPVYIGGLQVTAFPKLHDACEPHSFVVACGNVKVGVFTDIGKPCEHLTLHFKQCHAAFLESNYDEELLEKGRYPNHLKKRIRGSFGHLSNKQALDFFVQHRPACMSHLILSHLSNENNCPTLVHNLFSKHKQGVNIVVASRFEETPVYTITGTYMGSQRPAVAMRPVQISLF
jgi:phosphoribosyl 1,2-cyclic phosphodiesterase